MREVNKAVAVNSARLDAAHYLVISLAKLILAAPES